MGVPSCRLPIMTTSITPWTNYRITTISWCGLCGWPVQTDLRTERKSRSLYDFCSRIMFGNWNNFKGALWSETVYMINYYYFNESQRNSLKLFRSAITNLVIDSVFWRCFGCFTRDLQHNSAILISARAGHTKLSFVVSKTSRPINISLNLSHIHNKTKRNFFIDAQGKTRIISYLSFSCNQVKSLKLLRHYIPVSCVSCVSHMQYILP